MTTDYADLVTLLQERAKLYDSRGSASVMLEAASAISALVREREWQPMETAPRDGPFLALNNDGEVWVSRFEEQWPHRLLFRTQALWEPKSYIVHDVDGKRLLEETTDQPEEWRSHWTIWTRGYEFKPTLWAPLPVLSSPGDAEDSA